MTLYNVSEKYEFSLSENQRFDAPVIRDRAGFLPRSFDAGAEGGDRTVLSREWNCCDCSLSAIMDHALNQIR